MNSHPSARQPWPTRAAAELQRVRSSDRLLAFLLEYESLVPADERETLLSLVVEHGRHIDSRVLAVLARDCQRFPAVAWNPHLSLEAAEWLAVELAASVRPPDRWIAARVYRELTTALSEVIRRYRLSARGLAGHVLYNEALGGPPGERTAFARNALQRLLLFPDVPGFWLDFLRRQWRDDAVVQRDLDAYRSGADGTELR